VARAQFQPRPERFEFDLDRLGLNPWHAGKDRRWCGIDELHGVFDVDVHPTLPDEFDDTRAPGPHIKEHEIDQSSA
jgi:hypothetical protein